MPYRLKRAISETDTLTYVYQTGAERDGRCGEVSPYIVCFRYQLFLQIKDDILAGRLECPFDYAVELGALALQCKSYHALTAVVFGIKVQRDDSFMQMAN